jgi:hypothetical protein
MKIQTSLLFLIISQLVLFTGCKTVHDFIGDKTNLELSDKIQVCSSASDDPKTCEPKKTGGYSWERNISFDVYSLTEKATPDDYENADDELRLRYLGTPYYNNQLQVFCKQNISADEIAPNDNIIIDFIDLTAELKSTAVDETTAELINSMKAEGVQISSKIEANIKRKLTKEVENKTNVQYLWFFMKWTGGFEAISKSESLESCVQEVDNKNNSNTLASLVTGVAGLIVLNNNIDTSIASKSTVSSVIRATIPSEFQGQAAKIENKISASWEKNVHKVFTTKGSLSPKTQVVYPLWIQFERRIES